MVARRLIPRLNEIGIGSRELLLGHPVVGQTWESLVIETLIAAAPDGTDASCYRTSNGAEVDLVLTLPGGGVWAIEVKRSSAPRLEKGFHSACGDLEPGPQARWDVNVPAILRGHLNVVNERRRLWKWLADLTHCLEMVHQGILEIRVGLALRVADGCASRNIGRVSGVARRCRLDHNRVASCRKRFAHSLTVQQREMPAPSGA